MERVVETVKLQDSADLLGWLAEYYKRPDTPVIVLMECQGLDLTRLRVIVSTLSDKSEVTTLHFDDEG